MIHRAPSQKEIKRIPEAYEHGELLFQKMRQSPGMHSARVLKKKNSSRHSIVGLKGRRDSGLEQCATVYSNQTPMQSPRRKFKKVKKTAKLIRPLTTVKKDSIRDKKMSSSSNQFPMDASTKGATTTEGISVSNSVMHGGASPGFLMRKN